MIYRSESTEEADGSTLITNSIANTILYDVEKIWLDENGVDVSQDKIGTDTEFAIYRATSGNQMTQYLSFTLDGVVDEQPWSCRWPTEPASPVRRPPPGGRRFWGCPGVQCGDGSQYE